MQLRMRAAMQSGIGPCRGGLNPAITTTQHKIQRPTLCKADSGEDAAAVLLRETEQLLAKLGKGGGSKPIPKGYQSEDEGLSPSLVVTCDVNGCVISPAASSPGPAGLVTPVRPEMTSIKVHEQNCPERFEYYEGMGWKLGFDPQPDSDDVYSAVVGSHDFSISLTRPEFYDFIQLLMSLRRSVATLDTGGEWGQQGNEATLEMETDRLWMQGRAPEKTLSMLKAWWQDGEAASQDGEAASQTGEAVSQNGEAGNQNGDFAGLKEEGLASAFALRVIVKSEGTREVEGAWHPVSTMNLISFIDSESGRYLQKIYSEAPQAQKATQIA